MKKVQYSITINASAAAVYDTMLGIKNKSTYEQWTSLFNPTSTYEGNWNTGSKILFTGLDANGNKEGMVSEIVKNVPNQFVSIRHYGILKAEQEITEGPDVEKWAGGLENYSFEEKSGITTVTIELESTEEFLNYMNTTYPKALAILKDICESNLDKS